MFNYQDIRILHLELTDKCNANCPMCPRTENGKLNPNLRLTELRLEKIKTILPVEFIRQLNFIYLCGNYGDPIMATDTLEILDYFREINPLVNLAMFTNASARDSKWWQSLGQLLNRKGDYVRFSIDGLEDTNHLYRQNTNWSRIIANAKSFISAGGIAFWDYLVFEHNHHQIQEAMAFAKELGFKEFYTKYSSRFASDIGQPMIQSFPVYDAQGNFQRSLRPLPKNYEGLEVLGDSQIHKSVGSTEQTELKPWIPYIKDAEYGASYLKKCVACKAQAELEIFISAEGFVMPCCWTAFVIRTTFEAEHIKQLRGYIFDQGLDSFSAFQQPLQKIIESPFFQKTLVEGWKKSEPEQGQIMLCQKFCNTESLLKQEFTNGTNLESAQFVPIRNS